MPQALLGVTEYPIFPISGSFRELRILNSRRKAEVISLSTFLTLKALHEEGVPKKTMARRLDLDVRTVRSWVSRIEAGATTPGQSPRPSKLVPLNEMISTT
ncbi:MAG: hypothetical protein H6807_15300 [Planctomycetes bacterium]|nr:hypothetical protein [Planctomycetota bacterium]